MITTIHETIDQLGGYRIASITAAVMEDIDVRNETRG
jgi:hypothetical protein